MPQHNNRGQMKTPLKELFNVNFQRRGKNRASNDKKKHTKMFQQLIEQIKTSRFYKELFNVNIWQETRRELQMVRKKKLKCLFQSLIENEYTEQIKPSRIYTKIRLPIHYTTALSLDETHKERVSKRWSLFVGIIAS